MFAFKRYMVSGTLALFMTAGIGLIMGNFIKGELPLQPAAERLAYEVNPIPDLQETNRKGKPVLQKLTAPPLDTILPPPAPILVNHSSIVPREQIITGCFGDVPIFPTKVDKPLTKIIATDKDTQPILRIAPIMPARAQKSGHCDVLLNVNAHGQPYNVRATFCTSSVFKNASIKSVSKWKYTPKTVNGKAVIRSKVETRIRFNYTDENGQTIPE